MPHFVDKVGDHSSWRHLLLSPATSSSHRSYSATQQLPGPLHVIICYTTHALIRLFWKSYTDSRRLLSHSSDLPPSSSTPQLVTSGAVTMFAQSLCQSLVGTVMDDLVWMLGGTESKCSFWKYIQCVWGIRRVLEPPSDNKCVQSRDVWSPVHRRRHTPTPLLTRCIVYCGNWNNIGLSPSTCTSLIKGWAHSTIGSCGVVQQGLWNNKLIL